MPLPVLFFRHRHQDYNSFFLKNSESEILSSRRKPAFRRASVHPLPKLKVLIDNLAFVLVMHPPARMCLIQPQIPAAFVGGGFFLFCIG
jgi:hypothetical protein